MNYIKSLTGVMELDYKTLMGTDIPYLDFIGNPLNIKTDQEIKFIKNIIFYDQTLNFKFFF